MSQNPNGNEPAWPIDALRPGFTKREEFAFGAMKEIIGKHGPNEYHLMSNMDDWALAVARGAVAYADALLTELER